MSTSLPMVVLVEDDVSTLKGLVRLLRAGGFEPMPYASAEAFLDSLPLDPPVCLVLDIKLDGMSGLDLLRRLRALRSSLPIIVMTAVDDDRIREAAMRLGCSSYLSKQSDAEHLLELLRTMPR